MSPATLLAVAATAHAILPERSLALAPERGGALVPCEDRVAAPCWDQALVTRRFAAAPGAWHAPQAADVRLAWEGDALLVWARELPYGFHLELSVSPDAGDDLARATWARLPAGLHRVPLDPPPRPGQRRGGRLALVADGGVVLHEAPWGEGRPGEPAHLVVVDGASSPGALELREGVQGLVLQAPGAAELHVVAERPTVEERPRRTVTPGWRVDGEGPTLVVGRPPDAGWLRVEAIWTRAGVPVAVRRLRAWWDPGPAPDGELLDLHPAPRELVHLQGSYSLSADARVTHAPGYGAAARLLAEELARFTGARLSVEEGRPRKADLWVGPPEASPVTVDGPLVHAREVDGFGLHASPERAVVVASSPRGAVYGALALADAVGFDGRVRAVAVGDAPALDTRVLVHRLEPRANARIDVDAWCTFLRRVVARGRYTHLVLILRTQVAWQADPTIAHPSALTAGEVARMVQAARDLGLVVVPGVNAPGHADWLLPSRPDLRDHPGARVLDVRNPASRELLDALYTEALQLFPGTPWLHIGHDEVFWDSWRSDLDERNPRTEGTPAWVLMAEDLAWHADWCRRHGVRPVVWADMLVEGWNGRREGSHRALELLSETDRDSLLAMTWAPTGDPVRALSGSGVQVIRAHTGYRDGFRDGLTDVADLLAGEGLALFHPTPWSAFGFTSGRKALAYHWPLVILAGTTAWRPTLADTAIGPTLDGLRDLPAFLPGAGPRRPGRDLELPAGGVPWLPGLTLLPSLDAGGRAWTPPSGGPVVVTRGAPLDLPATGGGVSLLLAADLTHEAEQRLFSAHPRASTLEGDPVAHVIVEHADGTVTRHPLRLGTHVGDVRHDPRALALYGTSGAAVVPAGPAGGPWAFHAIDVAARGPVTRVRLEVLVEGVAVLVAGARSLEP